MNAFDRLNAASVAAMSGNHEEALQGFLWFHRNALSEQPSLYGVRLSFAIGRWADLAKSYPPAQEALARVRDESAARLLDGDGGCALFHDVMTIDEHIGAIRLTYELYLKLLAARPDMATECARLAIPAIIAARDYPLAKRLLPPADPAIRELAVRLEADINGIKSRPYSNAPRRWAEIRNYALSVQEYLTVLRGIGQVREALRLYALALDSIRSPSVRRDVRAEFIHPASAPARVRRHPRSRRIRRPA